LHYASLDEEEFEETGAGGIDLIVEDRRTESLVSELGLRVGRPIETNLGLLMPQLSIAWAHDFNVDDRKITARFADSPSTAFTVKGSDIESDAVRLGGFLTLTGSNELAVSAGFNAELRENSSDVSGLIKLQFRF
jgi:outer membrane autotransporter protein